jgi:mannonate dehydratase
MRLGVSHRRREQLTPEHLRYLHQMGVEAVEVRIPSARSSLEDILDVKRRVEAAGLAVHEIMLADGYNFTRAAVGHPEGEDEIRRFVGFLQDLGRAGVDTTTYAWHTGGAFRTGTATTRGCSTRLFELAEARRMQPAYGREYGDDEVWRAYERWLERVLPVAESTGVRLQLHPNDPPVSHAGVARIFRSSAAFERAMDLAGHSPWSGVLFCVGCWAEMSGADGQGEDIRAAIRSLGGRGHIFQVHFRNIDGPLPDFRETFPDNGYVDMASLVRELAAVGFAGMIVPDHVPRPEGSEATVQTAEGYVLGYIRGLMDSTPAPRRGARR